MKGRVLRRLVAVMSVAALGVLALAPGAPASFPGRNGRIAIVTTPDKPLDYKTSTIRPDGTHPRPMPGPKSAGFWSPDGTRFLFEGVCHAKGGCGNTGAAGPNELRTVGPNGRGLRVIHFSFPKSYPGGPTDATWSPTGRRLVYVRYFPDEGGPAALFISSSRGTHERLLTAPTSPIYFWPRWSPDGSEIAFIVGNSLLALRPDGSGLRTIVPCEPPRQGPAAPGCEVDGFDWSPDGSQLAVAEEIVQPPTVEQDVFVVDRSGASLRELRAGAAPFWSPDGKRIGSILRPAGLPDDKGGSLQISNADGSGLRTVRKGVFFADWQPLPR